MDNLAEKETHTRFWYAVGSTLLTFAYFGIVDPEHHAGAWQFLMVVAGGFGIAKATQHLKVK